MEDFVADECENPRGMTEEESILEALEEDNTR
jgi:hypothetical protein